MIKKLIRALAWRNIRFRSLYVKLCNPSGEEFAAFVKHHRLFFAMGDNCSINSDTYIGDAKYVRMGNNVRLASCTLIAHDGVINMLMNAYPYKLDAVGKIDIGDNVFIGNRATVLRGVTIGNNCVVAAGSMVIKDVAANSVVGGVPAKFIKSTDQLAEKLRTESASLPWFEIIEKRVGGFDPLLEPQLDAARRKHFFGPRPDDA